MARPAPTDARIRRRRLTALALLVIAVLLSAALLRSACAGDEPPFTGKLSERARRPHLARRPGTGPT
jgi:hypothetical protein